MSMVFIWCIWEDHLHELNTHPATHPPPPTKKNNNSFRGKSKKEYYNLPTPEPPPPLAPKFSREK